jgi:hypothetical protein
MISRHLLLCIGLMIQFNISTLYSAIETGFFADTVVFQDGSGWQEVTENVCGEFTRPLKAMGTTLSSNGIVLDSTVGIINDFTDTTLTGMILPFASPTLPVGWLPCDGRLIDMTLPENCSYQGLANKIQNIWGGTGTMVNGTWTGTIRLPDLRGYFLRGANTGANKQSTTIDVNRENAADTANYQRYTAPDFSTTTASLLTIGTYQRSSFTQHTGQTATVPVQSIGFALETHNHPSNQGTLNPTTYKFYAQSTIPNFYDIDSPAIPLFLGDNQLYTGNTTTDSNTHTHTFSNSNPHDITLADTTSESHPNNAGVVYGIRF